MLSSMNGAEIVHVVGENFYPDQLWAKPFNVLQAKTMQRMSMTGDVRGIIKLVGECISIDVNQLFQDDFKYLVHWLRLNSFKDFPRILQWKCPFCETMNETEVKSSSLVYKDVSDELINGGLWMKFDNFDDAFFVRAQKISDEKFASDLLKQERISEDNVEMTNIIMNLNLLRSKENGLTLQDLYGMYKNDKFTNDDMAALDIFRDDYSWGVEDKYKFTCEHCQEEVTVDAPFNITNFFQFDGSKRNLRKRILSNVPTATTISDDRADGVQRVLMDVQETRESSGGTETDEGGAGIP